MNAVLDFEYEPFTKDFRLKDALWKLYVPIIQKKIEENTYLIAALLSGSGWTSKGKGKNPISYRELYIQKRNSKNWGTYREEISNKATTMWDYYKNIFIADFPEDIHDLGHKWGVALASGDLDGFLKIRRLS